MKQAFAILLLISTCGCVAKAVADTAVSIVKVPFKVGSKAVDLATTSSRERDEKFVRRLRKDCEQWEKDRRKAEKKAYKTGDWSHLPEAPNDSCA
ncbi:MAG: hypothetical protein WA979_08090 [Pacificimonas sp.]